MKRILLPLFIMLLPLIAGAYDVEIDGIYYNLDTEAKTAEVTYKDYSYNSYSGSITIPATILNGTYSVTSIGVYAFQKCSDLTSVEMPNSITSIGNQAFVACSSLMAVEIPNSVKTIGRSAFSGCTGLTSIVIPNSVRSIYNYAFQGCTGLTSIEIPNSVTSIGEGAFYNTAWYKNQPDGLVYAGLVAYKYKGEMPDNTNIVLKDNTKGITKQAFYGCTSLTSIEIPNSVTNIGEQAFYECRNLTSISIGSGVSYIGNDAFYNCFNFKKVTIYDIAAWCKIDFESSRNSNPLDYAKYFYLNDERVYDLIIPNGVTKIQGAFRSCTDFTSIKVCCNRPPVISSTEFSVSKEIPLYVPKGTAMMYMSATGWNEFTNIVEFEDGGDAHYITIRMGNGGALKQSVEIGKTYLYVVQPDEGWSVSTVTFNGTNMTSMLIDGQFSTPVIIGNSELNVVFKQNASSAKAMQIESNVKVSAYNGTIRITGAENSAVVNVYNTSGMLVGSSFGNATFTLDSGIYIVKVRDETFKLNL